MQINLRKAFTMVELIFVIIVIGVLAAIALPRFGESADTAHLAKAQSEVATIRAALSTERQKRVLRGDFTNITDLARKADDSESEGNAFDHFSKDRDNNNAPIFQYPIRECNNASARGCWDRDGVNYTFRFLDPSDGNDGQAEFILQNNRFDCKSTDTSDCQRITL